MSPESIEFSADKILQVCNTSGWTELLAQFRRYTTGMVGKCTKRRSAKSRTSPQSFSKVTWCCFYFVYLLSMVRLGSQITSFLCHVFFCMVVFSIYFLLSNKLILASCWTLVSLPKSQYLNQSVQEKCSAVYFFCNTFVYNFE